MTRKLHYLSRNDGHQAVVTTDETHILPDDTAITRDEFIELFVLIASTNARCEIRESLERLEESPLRIGVRKASHVG